jgi:hypothetical protein
MPSNTGLFLRLAAIAIFAAAGLDATPRYQAIDPDGGVDAAIHAAQIRTGRPVTGGPEPDDDEALVQLCGIGGGSGTEDVGIELDSIAEFHGSLPQGCSGDEHKPKSAGRIS